MFGYTGGGTDRVFASASYHLHGTGGVEKISTANNNGTEAINLTGDGGSQDIYGNAGANRLGDGGGAFADNLIGLGGNDSYVLTNRVSSTSGFSTKSQVYEAVGGGVDDVTVSGNWVATAGSEIEVIRITDGKQITGNGFSQTIYGNEDGNIFDGGGGNDTFYGADTGPNRGSAQALAHDNDQYYVEAGDHVVELAGIGWAGEGVDRVWARTSYTLDAGSWVEQLTTSSANGTAAIDLTGNELYQMIYGNAGNNIIDGKGGSDELFGLGGADSFAFTSALGAGNVDGLYDYQVGTDHILLDDSVFTGLAAGALASGAFVAGTAALDADDRIIFDQATGRIFFDQDGSGGAFGAVEFAFVANGQILTASDFTVI